MNLTIIVYISDSYLCEVANFLSSNLLGEIFSPNYSQKESYPVDGN